MSAAEACERAIELGLEGLAFTDHLDYDFPEYEEDFLIDFEKYSLFMDRLKESYSEKLKVIKGLEAGVQPHVIEKTAEVIKKYDFDFVIGSVHLIKGQDPYNKQFYTDLTRFEAYKGYLEEIELMTRNFNEFDVLAHFDYITRYNYYEDRTLRYKEHKDLIDSIFTTIIYKGKGIELNTGSFRYTRNNSTYELDLEILRRYRELGGEIICLGSDAHSLNTIGFQFDYFKNILRETGFKYFTHFENRKPVFSPID
jgi:histidinol-phosphatase (PHP family)